MIEVRMVVDRATDRSRDAVGAAADAAKRLMSTEG